MHKREGARIEEEEERSGEKEAHSEQAERIGGGEHQQEAGGEAAGEVEREQE